METIIEFTNGEIQLRLENGALYNNPKKMAIFWKDDNHKEWQKQGYADIEKWDAQIALFESNGFTRV